MNVVKGFSVFFGWIAALAAILMLVTGGALLWFEAQNETDGFYVSDTLAVRVGSHALYAPDLDIVEDVPGWFSEEWFAADRWETIRVTGRSVAGKELFIGLARRGAIDTYLSGTAHHRLAAVDLRPIQGSAQRIDGATPRAPVDEGFWESSARGDEIAVLEWPVRDGSWGIVVMNADGSQPVAANVILAAEVPFVGLAGTRLLVAGIGAFVLALVLLYFGGRARPERALERDVQRAERRRVKAEAAADARKTREETRAAARAERAQADEARTEATAATTSTSSPASLLTEPDESIASSSSAGTESNEGTDRSSEA